MQSYGIVHQLMKTILRLSLLVFLIATFVSITKGQNNYTLNALGTFGFNGDGSVRPGDPAYNLDANFNQRGLWCDPLSTNLVLVDTHSGSGGGGSVTGNVYVVNWVNGSSTVGLLSTNGIVQGNYADTGVAIADDGAVYLCNQVNVSTNVGTPFKIYRYSSVSDPNPPLVVYSNTISPSQRYGVSWSIRGAGTNTQILMGSMPGTTATNVVIFTTADGTNLTANIIGCTNVLSPNFNDGIAFGAGNTFWAKRVGAPLLYMSFDLTAKTAAVISSFGTTNISGVNNLAGLAVNTNLNLLAALEETGGAVAGGADRLWLFDISNLSKPPSLLAIRSFVPNNQNATAPMGYLTFGGQGTLLFANVVNNGLLGNTVDYVATPAPTYDLDLLGTNRVAVGQTAHFEARAYPAISTYQWFTNGVAVSGATNFYLDVTNVSLTDSGRVYQVVATNAGGFTASAQSLLSVLNPADLYHLNLLWRYGPAQTNFFIGTGTGTPTERTIAYNSVSNQLIVVQRSTASSAIVRLYVVDPNTGQFLYNLKTNGITGAANIPLCGAACAADGAFYACSGSTASDPNFRVYRWADTGSNTLPVIVFGTNTFLTSPSGNPAQGVTTAQFRWGDNLDASGSGTDTQLIVDNQDATTFRYMGILRPSDSTMTNWGSKGFVLQNAGGGTQIGRSLQFSGNGSFYQHRYGVGGAPLVGSTYTITDPDPSFSPVAVSGLGMIAFTNNGGVGADWTYNKIGAAVNFTFGGTVAGASPDTLDLYDLGAPDTPVLINRYNFPVNAVANNNRISQVIMTTNYCFALDAGNGIMGFQVASGPIPKPIILTQPTNLRMIQGGSGTLGVTVDQTVTYQWYRNGVGVLNATNASLVFTSAQTYTNGNYTVIAGNVNGSVTSVVASVTVSLAQDNYSLTPVWSVGAGTQPFIAYSGNANTPNERSIAYNAMSNQLIVVHCPVSSTAFTNFVLDASSGALLYTMDVSGITHVGPSEVSGSNPIDLVSAGCSDDGALFVGNETPNAGGGVSSPDPSKAYRIYYWSNTAPTTTALNVFIGDPANQTGVNYRYGDDLAVRGSGTNTELIVSSGDGAYAAILKPTDASLATFSNFPYASQLGSGSIGRSLQFASGTNVWQKRKGAPLKFSGYDTNLQTSVVLSNLNFSTTLGGVTVDLSRSLAIGVDYVGSASTPDGLAIYDISDPTAPMFIARYSFPANQAGNANFIGQVIIVGNKVWALDANSSLAMFTINGPPLTITPAGTNVVINWPLFSGFTLQSTPSLAPPVTWSTVGTGTIVNGKYAVTNAASASSLYYRLVK